MEHSCTFCTAYFFLHFKFVSDLQTTVLSINVNAPMAGHHGKEVACRGGGRRGGPWRANGGNGNGNSTADADANAGMFL